MLVSAPKMPNVAVFGAQWGDEGKGKIVDLLCERFEVVARYQGGHNAGHTVKFADKHFALRLIPSGILHRDKLCILGNGMVIDPDALLEEIESLRAAGVTIDSNLKISDSAHLILPYHKALDLAREEAAGAAKIGTTGRGIGPAYETKASRYGIRVCDLLDPTTLRERVEFACAEKNAVLATLYHKKTFDPDVIVNAYVHYGEVLAERITNATVLINNQIRAGKSVLFEGAQGMMLDVDHGTYPFVTSSNTIVGGVCTGLGIAPKHIHRVIGVALTKLDVLDEIDEIPVCTAYNVHGEEWKTFPAFAVAHNNYKPVHRTFRGWKRSTVGTTSFKDLPQQALDYIRFIEDETECRISIVSTGPRREETIIR